MKERAVGLLSVAGEHEEEVDADRADVHITVRGSSILSGAVGLRTVREVAELVAELERIGVAESDIHLHSVTADVNSRPIGKSSSAVCKLRIRCAELSQMPAIVLSISSARQASVDYTEWGYSNLSAVETVCLSGAFRQAAEKAQRSAEALAVRLGGIKRAREISSTRPRPYAPPLYGSAGEAMRLMDMEASVPEVPMGESKKVTAHVEVVYFLVPAND